jgi:hypothetical protein
MVCMVVGAVVWPMITGSPPLFGMGMLKEPMPQRQAQLQAPLESIVPVPGTTCPGDPTASIADDVLVVDPGAVGLMAVTNIGDPLPIVIAAGILIKVVSNPTGGKDTLTAVTTLGDSVGIVIAAGILSAVAGTLGPLMAVTIIGGAVAIVIAAGMLIKVVSSWACALKS